MNKIKGIIFDLDGVICSTDEYHYLAWKGLADRLGLTFDRNINRKLRGVSRMESLEIILGEHGADYSEKKKLDLAEEKNRRYREFLSRMTPGDLASEIRSTLDALQERGYLLAIGSSSRNTMQILERLGLDGFFDAVADGTQITHSKPHPEVFLLAAAKLGISPEEALVIEDAQAGVEAARAGGFRVVGIRTEENDPHADITIRWLWNLLDIL